MPLFSTIWVTEQRCENPFRGCPCRTVSATPRLSPSLPHRERLRLGSLSDTVTHDTQLCHVEQRTSNLNGPAHGPLSVLYAVVLPLLRCPFLSLSFFFLSLLCPQVTTLCFLVPPRPLPPPSPRALRLLAERGWQVLGGPWKSEAKRNELWLIQSSAKASEGGRHPLASHATTVAAPNGSSSPPLAKGEYNHGSARGPLPNDSNGTPYCSCALQISAPDIHPTYRSRTRFISAKGTALLGHYHCALTTFATSQLLPPTPRKTSRLGNDGSFARALKRTLFQLGPEGQIMRRAFGMNQHAGRVCGLHDHMLVAIHVHSA